MSSAVFVACATTPQKVVNKGRWNNQMHRLSVTMSSLMPIVNGKGQFFREQNSEFISTQLKELTSASVEVAEEATNQTNPLVQHAAKAFAQDMSLASSNFDRGNRQVARFVVSNMASHCINCHTRMDVGTKDFPISWTTNLTSLDPMQKTQFYLANRQYKSALSQVQKVVGDKKSVMADPEGWRQTIERTLAMLIRVEGDVKGTIAISQAVAENPSVPLYMQRESRVWLRDAGIWQTDRMKDRSPKAKLALAVSLIKDGRNFLTPQSHAALISNLRASALLQEVLVNPKSKNYSEALYYSGITSELLPGLTPLSVNETYYEACIRASPHTYIAMKCYAQLETSTYSSVSNVEYDEDLQVFKNKRLKELLALAEVSDHSQGNGPDYDRGM
jgi:hypothetical protein